MKPARFTHLLLIGLMTLLLSGCTKSAKAKRYLARADRYFQSAEYDKAEIEYLNALRLGRPGPDTFQRLGTIYYEQGRYLQAMPFLLKAKELDGNNLDIRLKAARIFVAGNRPKEARDEALFIIGKNPTNEEAFLVLAQSARNTNDLVEVRKQLERLRPSSSNLAGFHLASAVMALNQRDPKAAGAELDRVLALNPRSSEAQLLRSGLFMSQRDLTNAEVALKAAADLAPTRSMTRLKYSDFKLQFGAVDEAKKVAEDIIAKAPDFVPAQVQLMKMAMGQGRLDDCEALVAKVLARDGSNFDAQLMRAQLLLARGKKEAGLKEMDRVATLYPKSSVAQYNLALAELVNGDLAKCTSSLNQAVRLDPDNADAVLLLAQLDLRKGDSRSAIEALVQLTRKQPGLIQAHMKLAEAYGIKGSLDEALAVYDRLMKAMPSDPQLPFLAGLILRDQKKPAEAMKSFQRSLELAPDNLTVIQQMVDMLVLDKKYDAARQLIDKPIAKYPNVAAPRVLLAATYLAQKEPAKAEEALLKAIEVDPTNSAPAYMLLSQVYIAGGKQQQALERLQSVVEKNPANVQALMQIGMINDQMKNYEAARAAYERILQLNPKFTAALNNLAYLNSEHLGRLDEAYDLAKRAREATGKDPYSADTLGWVLFRRGDYAAAQTLLEESAKALPAEAEIQYHLGMAHYMLGEEGPARASLQRAAQAPKEFTGKADAQRALAVLALDPAKADPPTVAALKKALSEKPADPIALSRLAAVYVRTGEGRQAVPLYEAAIKADPKSAVLQLRLAELYATQMQNPAKALEYARSARNLDPTDPRFGCQVARVAAQAGDSKWAFSLLQDSSKKLPDDADVLYDLAVAGYGVGRAAEAEANLRSALKANPDFSRAVTARALLELMSAAANPAQAVQAMPRALAILKTDTNSVPAEMVVGVACEQQGNVAQARQAYERIIARSPDFSPAVRRLAILLANQGGDDAKAQALVAKAREAFPSDSELAKALGLLAFRQGETARAAQYFKESLGQRSNDPEALYYLGMAHYQLKEAPASKVALQKAVALKLPADKDKEAKRVLAELK